MVTTYVTINSVSGFINRDQTTVSAGRGMEMPSIATADCYYLWVNDLWKALIWTERSLIHCWFISPANKELVVQWHEQDHSTASQLKSFLQGLTQVEKKNWHWTIVLQLKQHSGKAMLLYQSTLQWSCHSPALSPCTYSSTVAWSSASVLASLSLRCLHSSAILSSSCCSSFKPAADLLSAWFFWWWKTHIFMVRFQYSDILLLPQIFGICSELYIKRKMWSLSVFLVCRIRFEYCIGKVACEMWMLSAFVTAAPSFSYLTFKSKQCFEFLLTL